MSLLTKIANMLIVKVNLKANGVIVLLLLMLLTSFLRNFALVLSMEILGQSLISGIL